MEASNEADDQVERLAEYAKEAILRLLRDYSEDNYAAGWIGNLEFDFWETIHARSGQGPYKRMGDSYRRKMRQMAADAGGWWYWKGVWDDDKFTAEVFVPLEEWTRIYGEHRSGSAQAGDGI